jgi:hypothetical protein
MPSQHQVRDLRRQVRTLHNRARIGAELVERLRVRKRSQEICERRFGHFGRLQTDAPNLKSLHAKQEARHHVA